MRFGIPVLAALALAVVPGVSSAAESTILDSVPSTALSNTEMAEVVGESLDLKIVVNGKTLADFKNYNKDVHKTYTYKENGKEHHIRVDYDHKKNSLKVVEDGKNRTTISHGNSISNDDRKWLDNFLKDLDKKLAGIRSGNHSLVKSSQFSSLF